MAGQKKKSNKKYTKVSILHYTKLVYRSVLLLLALYWYIFHRVNDISLTVRDMSINIRLDWIMTIITVVYIIEMLLRLFPSDLESPGCQKQFRKNYIPTGEINVELHDNHATVIVALVWILLNGVIGALYMTHVIDEGILWLIALFYGVCDMICILFFCPFQTWFLKNKCCSLCRIYNWDFAMMFTPLFFIPGIRTWTLLFLAVVILVKWEITVWLYPEQFSENTNAYLKCANCNEKLCLHKTQLNSVRASLAKLAEKRIQRILQLDLVKNFKKKDDNDE